MFFFFFSSRRRHTRCSRDWSSDVCSSDLNLSKVVLYQLSYSRVPPQSNRPVGLFLPTGCPPDRPSARSGGEGDRTPDLVNAIHALSQLSYAPVILGPAKRVPAGTRHLIWSL